MNIKLISVVLAIAFSAASFASTDDDKNSVENLRNAESFAMKIFKIGQTPEEYVKSATQNKTLTASDRKAMHDYKFVCITAEFSGRTLMCFPQSPITSATN